jgi:peptide/nickel transport system substrate-binding protein
MHQRGADHLGLFGRLRRACRHRHDAAEEASRHRSGGAEPAAGPFEPMVMAAENCDYGGVFKSMEAVDELTVKFTLCYPDVAFPAKAAFSAFAINDADYLEATGGGGDLIENPNGTGPYTLAEWRRGDQMIFQRFEELLGRPAIPATVVFRWGAESAQRLVELQAGTVDGIDGVGPMISPPSRSDPNLQLATAQRHQHLLCGHEQHVPALRQRARAPGLCHGHRPPAPDRQLLPAGFLGGDAVHAAVHLWLQRRPGMVRLRPGRGQADLEEEGVLPGFKTTITYRDVVRGYLPNPGIVAQDIQAQLADLGVEAEIVVMESGAFLDRRRRWRRSMASTCWVGAPTIRMPPTSWTSTLAPAPRRSLVKASRTSGTRCKGGSTQATPEDRQPFYDTANELIKQHVPMIPVAHGGNARPSRRTSKAPTHPISAPSSLR